MSSPLARAHSCLFWISLLVFVCPLSVYGSGALRYGFGARDAGAAGVFGDSGEDPLAAMQTNPAALAAFDRNTYTIALKAGWGNGEFSRGGGTYNMDIYRAFPEFGLVWVPEYSSFVWGLSVAPIAGGDADWTFPDAPGGIGGISYGSHLPHNSGFLSIRANVGVAWSINDEWSVGASLGATYNEVSFDAPFIFQTNPALAGAKVDLDMETSGWEPMAEFGILWRPDDAWSLGLHFRPPVNLALDGDAVADFSAQLPPLGLGGTPPYNYYNADTKNALPMVIGGAIRWETTERLTTGLRVDWIGWEDAFDDLQVALSGGNNGAINGAIGSVVTDQVPVAWRDTWVVGLGADYQINDCLSVRGGWRWSQSLARDSYITPLNGSQFQHTLAVGLGWQRENWRLDLSYEYLFGSTTNVGASGYNVGEYSNSSLKMDAHVIGIGITANY